MKITCPPTIQELHLKIRSSFTIGGLILFALLVIWSSKVFASCDPEERGFRPLNYNIIDIGCLPGLIDNLGPSLVIRNQREYENLIVEYDQKTREKHKELWGVSTDRELNAGFPFTECNAELTPIDFERYTLMLHGASGTGCQTIFENDIQIDRSGKEVKFAIHVTEHGACEPFRTHRSSLLIPKISDDYTVTFNISRTTNR